MDLPLNWFTRPYQDNLWRYLAAGGKRACALWHRRSGKDELSLHWTATAAMTRVGNYWHMLPKANQARKAIWEAINPHTGKRRIDEAFPLEIRDLTRSNEMMIRFKNGSTWQVVGSDNYNQLVGASPVGIVFSEYSISDPGAWDYLRPILAENGGWSIFIYTARGKNHGYTLYRMAEKNPEWFCERLTVDDTKAISLDAVEEERKSGMSDDMIQQEFYCSFEAANPGAYYGKQIAQAWKDGRIGKVPIEPGVTCETWWDLGMDDSMAIWITQSVVREIRVVQYYENSGEGLAHYAKWLGDWARERDVSFARHGMPHDIEVRELGTGKSRKEVCERQLGLKPVAVAPNLDLESGIEQTRRILSQCWFDETNCERGISALTEYSKEWDEKAKVFAQRPAHNWASHGADALRTMALIHPGRANAPASSDRYNSREKRQSSWMSA